jgi:hypothetical protein
MTNRARPTWPDGAADSSKSQRPPSGANGKSQSTPPATPTSNGRNPASNGSGQPRPGTANSPKPGEFRPPQRPATPPPANQSGSSATKPARPAQQPPVRPVVKQAPPTTPRPVVNPSTPGRPEPRLTGPGTGSVPGAASGLATPPAVPAYGQTGKVSTPDKPETFGDKVNAAKQAVLEKAAAVREAATQGGSTQGGSAGKVRTATEPVPRTSNRPQTRKARLRLSRLDPWSVMKTAFLLSIAFGIVTWVAVFIVWSAIGAAGVFTNIDNTVNQVLGSPSAEPFRIENYINTGKVMGFTTLLACADVLIITALATLGSFLYNIAATLLGGLEVTLASED